MTATTLQRLLKYPHPAVFDKDPKAALVLRVRHASGCVWRVEAGIMSVTVGTAAPLTYNLQSFTIGGLKAALLADGLEVIDITDRYDTHSAMVLVEGGGSAADQFDGVYPIPGDQYVSNGDHVYAYTSLLWALMSTYSRELDAAAYQVRQALLQMVIATAEGEWLDLWGTIYSVPRVDGETDVDLRSRIPREAFRLRVNPRAIELAIKDLTGKTVSILEPWKDIFTLDVSLLSGPDKMQDSDHVGPFLIQPYSETPIDWSDVLPIIERNRPAGVLSLPPKGRIGTSISVPGEYTVEIEVRRTHTGVAVIEDMALLDVSDIEDVSVPNDPFLRRTKKLNLISVGYVGQTFLPMAWRDEAWSDQTVVVEVGHTSTTAP